jgi:hypothetical protein
MLSAPAKKIGCPIQAVFWLEWDPAGPNRPLSLCHHKGKQSQMTLALLLASPSFLR